MRCSEVRSLLSIYSVGGLSRRARGRTEAHVRDCTGCRAELAGLDRLDRVLKGVGHEVPPSLWPGIAARLAPRRATPWLPLVAPTAVAAALSAALVIAVLGREPSAYRPLPPPLIVAAVPDADAGAATDEDREVFGWYAQASFSVPGGDSLATALALDRTKAEGGAR